MADDHIKQTLDVLEAELHKQEEDVIGTKRLINTLRARTGLPLKYADADLTSSNSVPLSIQSDQFYGRPLAGCMRAILEMRRVLKQGPASVNDIYDALKQGGYKFDVKNEDNAKRGVRISLMKNIAVFHKLPNNLFGLTEWYPKVKGGVKRRDESDADDGADDEQEQTSSDNGGKGGKS